MDYSPEQSAKVSTSSLFDRNRFLCRLKIIRLLIPLLLLSFYSCQREEIVVIDKPDPPSGSPNQYMKSVNNWIWDVMGEIYYWNEDLPDSLDPDTEPDPTKYIDKLISPEDKFSRYLDAAQIVEAGFFDYSYSFGWNLLFGRFSNDPQHFFVVINYVVPGGPAYHLGLKRGDIIVKNNGQPISERMLPNFITNDVLMLGMGVLRDGYIDDAKRQIKIRASSHRNTPLLAHKVLGAYNGRQVAYLAYGQFKSGSSGTFNKDLDDVISDFRNKGVNELILDLRYNPGGDLEAAVHLASLLAPGRVVEKEEPFIKLEWNKRLMKLFSNLHGEESDYTNIRFRHTRLNLDLERLMVLTTRSTASASELLILGLKPYMDVVTIGTQTFGKNYGVYNIPYYGETTEIDRILAPVSTRYSNIQGEITGIGIPSNYAAMDHVIKGHDLGSTNDLMMAIAINIINGDLKSGSSSEAVPRFELFEIPVNLFHENLIINSEGFLQLPAKD